MRTWTPYAILTAGLFLTACSDSAIKGPPPDVSLKASSREGTAPLGVTFTVGFSEASEYTILRYEWDFDGNDTVDQTTLPSNGGVVTKTTGTETTYEYPQAGEYSPKVHVWYNENSAGSWAYLDLVEWPDKTYTQTIRVSE